MIYRWIKLILLENIDYASFLQMPMVHFKERWDAGEIEVVAMV
jgi:hypothetical protein